MHVLFEDGTGFCPWHKRDSSFELVHEVRYALPEYRGANAAIGVCRMLACVSTWRITFSMSSVCVGPAGVVKNMLAAAPL